ncbi:MAG: serine/threonine-protein kinase [Acidimicrobiales bacterium]
MTGGGTVDQIADYIFVRALAEGNHGQFFLAKPPARLPISAEHVAVKVLAGHTSEEAFRRATKELRAFASVRSPYLVSLYDAGQDGGTFYYAMEYLPLGSLAAPARPLGRPEVLRAVAHAARAAHALHESGVVHRDIKPANVLITESGGKLSDLGLAQSLNPGMTMTGMGPIGSIEFIDPAILRGGRASRASDIWSLGMTLHRALAGTGAYGELPDTDPLLAMRRILSVEPTIDSNLPAEERALIVACLAADPVERPRTAEEFADRVEQMAAA